MTIKLGIPRFGIYSNIIKLFFNDAGITIIMPTKISREMISLGVTNSSDMMCFPYKVTLGQQIWCLEHGATDLIMWDNAGLCRQKHYYQLQESVLKRLGYQFQMHNICLENAFDKATEIFGLTKKSILSKSTEIYRKILDVENKAYGSNGHMLKIGIIGEIYTILEHGINFDIIKKLQRMGVDVDISVKISDFIRHNWLNENEKEEEQSEAKRILSAEIGGHGFHSIYNTIWYGKNNFDGVIHLMPLSCMPESTVEPLVDLVAEKYKIPLYRFPIDENNFETGVNTRLETFVSMLKRKCHDRIIDTIP